MNKTQIDDARKVALMIAAIIDVIKDAGQIGVPGGTIYAGLMTTGASLEQFKKFMSLIVRTGKVVKRGDCYFAS